MFICLTGPEAIVCGAGGEEDQSYRRHFPSGLYASYSQVLMPSFNFFEHHTYITNCLLGISM